jgi:hypothetical protein
MMMMSKTNDASKLDRAKIENRVLADSELDAVSGGMLCLDVEDLNVGGLHRSSPGGKTDVIKVMGNTGWGDITLN